MEDAGFQETEGGRQSVGRDGGRDGYGEKGCVDHGKESLGCRVERIVRAQRRGFEEEPREGLQRSYTSSFNEDVAVAVFQVDMFERNL